MKTIKLPVFFLLIAFCLSSQAQVAINKDGSIPAATSILHVKGDDSGTPVEAMFIQLSTGNVGIGTISPDTDLNIYSNADNNGLTLQTSDNTFSQGIRFRNSGGSYTWNIYRKDAGSSHADLVFANGFSTDLSTFTEWVTFKDGGSVGIGTTNPDASAALHISSTSRGFLPPRMTASQMQAITSPATGLCVFNTDVNAQCTYNGSSWDCCDSQSLFDDLFFECGNIYKDFTTGDEFSTVLINNQCWMAENLNIGTKINGSVNQTNNSTIEKYCYDDDEANCDTYGGLYQWDEMMQYVTTDGVQGICPNGWHLPTYGEWVLLSDYLGGTSVAGGKMKETGTVHWQSPNTGATNESGFTGLPGGSCSSGLFNNLGSYGYWWSSSQNTPTLAWYRSLSGISSTLHQNTNDKANGFSIRCLRN